MEKEIGESLKNVLFQNNISPERLSKLIDLPASQISTTLSGKRFPSTNMLVSMELLGLIDAKEYLLKIIDWKIDFHKKIISKVKAEKVNALLKVASESTGKEKADALFELKHLI